MASSMFVRFSFVVVVMVVGCLVEPSDALEYYVGGKEGWSLKPSKTFNHWASLNRFQVHDSLIFKYENGTDSVLQVDQEGYITCNKTNPILALENKGDHSTFDLDHSGFFFFISGHADNCQKGQKVIILVMAPRNYTHKSPTHAPAPSQQASAPGPSVVEGISPVSGQAPGPSQGISPVSSQAPAPFQEISPVSSQAPGPSQGISPVSSQAPAPFEGISPVSSQAPGPSQGISPVSSQAPAPFQGVPHVLPPAQSPVHKPRPITSPAPAPSRVGSSTHHHTHSPAPAPSRAGASTHHHTTPAPAPSRAGTSTSTHHHHTHSPAPSPSRVATTTHHHPPAASPVQQVTAAPSPAPTPINKNPPAASPGPSQAAAPGPSDQAPSPDDGQSAAAATSFGGDLLMAALLVWMIFT
ncbi:hypothetical protein DCAR_0418074 [Daucus carota subsp. sativus]|uniref:Phytocyanin domain-containing protein n=1 Tax=Daucus carota subsp. sativus TaxID=79200 RepID=A0AAF1AXU4_DAUCS|nr:PREDICTED: early nodulin-like protein 1 [Daucus carota subsp. sativus]WOG98729.1 hypothetical protein DCAR_0418074 [Daucus carota subsp. sativus]